MELISKEKFSKLLNYKGDTCISVYVPTHRSGLAVNEKQDAILFKNALQDIEGQLSTQGMLPEDVSVLLKPAYELYKDEEFWNAQLQGLAVFITSNGLEVLKLPYTVNEERYINNSFFVTPLLEAVTANEEFYLLVLSKHDAKLYQGDTFGLQHLEVEGLPNGMDDVVHFEEKEGQQLLRQGGKGGNGSANFHGHGSGQPDEKTNLATYFREVDRTLFTEVLHDKNKPLVLAGVEYLIPIYREVSKYNFIAEDAITGNQERESLQNLFAKARDVLAPYFKERVNKALKNYYDHLATSGTSSMPDKVIPASHYAQISDLFISKGEHIWGTFNEADNQLTIHTAKQDGDECLLNQAALKTIANGGSVYVLDKEKMPKDSTIAAYLRF